MSSVGLAYVKDKSFMRNVRNVEINKVFGAVKDVKAFSKFGFTS